MYADQSGATATFYLAAVDPVYAGKEMDIELFDPGEGASSIEILDPNGNPVLFKYGTVDDNTGLPDSAAAKGFAPMSGGPTSMLNVSGTITPPSGFASHSQYSDRHLVLKTTIPANYASIYNAANGGWYKIRYNTSSASVTDRTTWSVRIVGNPVHLVE